MKRNLNVKITQPRSETPLLDDKGKPQLHADYVITSLDMFAGKMQGISSRDIGELSDRIYKAKSPPKEVELSTAEADLIGAALEQMSYPNFVKRQIATALEAR